MRSDNEARFEDFGLEMQIKLREGFLTLADEFPKRFIVVDGNRNEFEVSRDISKLLVEID